MSLYPSALKKAGLKAQAVGKIYLAKLPVSPGSLMRLRLKGDIIMCVGLPARVVTIKDGVALVDASGAKRQVSAELLDDLDPGDYVMVHAGIAIAKITSDDKTETDAIMEAL